MPCSSELLRMGGGHTVSRSPHAETQASPSPIVWRYHLRSSAAARPQTGRVEEGGRGEGKERQGGESARPRARE